MVLYYNFAYDRTSDGPRNQYLTILILIFQRIIILMRFILYGKIYDYLAQYFMYNAYIAAETIIFVIA